MLRYISLHLYQRTMQLILGPIAGDQKLIRPHFLWILGERFVQGLPPVRISFRTDLQNSVLHEKGWSPHSGQSLVHSLLSFGFLPLNEKCPIPQFSDGDQIPLPCWRRFQNVDRGLPGKAPPLVAERFR